MSQSFNDYLTENTRATSAGQLYSKFGQVVINLGEVQTQFSENKGIKATTALIKKTVALHNALAESFKADQNVRLHNIDMALAENVSTANILLENEYEKLPLHEVAFAKDVILVPESRLPSLVFDVESHDIARLVEDLYSVGYKKKDIHIAINVHEMKVQMQPSDRAIIEALSFDGINASTMLATAKNIDLGDVYVAFNECVCTKELSNITEMKIKTGSKLLKLHEMNRFVMNNLIAAPSEKSDYGLKENEGAGEVITCEGFKAYDFKQHEFSIFESSVFSTKDLSVEPHSADAWNKFAQVDEAFIVNGWVIEHDRKTVKLTNANEALRANQTCEQYVFEVKQDGYPLLDLIHIAEQNGNKDWTCQGLAEAILSVDGKVTPDQQTAVSYSISKPSNSTFHPNQAARLREATELTESVDSVLRVIANDQFSSLTIKGSDKTTKLDESTVSGILKSIVENGFTGAITNDTVEFTTDGVTYSLKSNLV